MTTKNPNLLLSDAAQPVNGINNAGIVAWAGGPIHIGVAASNWGPATTVQLMTCTKYPATGLPFQADNTTPTIAATDWVPLAAAFTANAELDLGNLNPCLLAVLVANSQAAARIRVIVQ